MTDRTTRQDPAPEVETHEDRDETSLQANPKRPALNTAAKQRIPGATGGMGAAGAGGPKGFGTGG